MKVNFSVKSDQLDKEDIRALLQAIRDCEMATFPQKEIYVSVEAPEMRSDDMTDILTSIKPPFNYGPVIFKYRERGQAAFLTWKCHICGEERPDDKIWVVTKPLIINGEVVGEQNIRYCNDRPTCVAGAKDFSFFPEE